MTPAEINARTQVFNQQVTVNRTGDVIIGPRPGRTLLVLSATTLSINVGVAPYSQQHLSNGFILQTGNTIFDFHTFGGVVGMQWVVLLPMGGPQTFDIIEAWAE